MSKEAKKALFMSGLSLFMVFLVFAGASYAWLASNRVVDTKGMTLQADTTSNLVISTDSVDSNALLSNMTTASKYTQTQVNFGNPTSLALLPATNTSKQAGTDTTTKSNLLRVDYTNSSAVISPSTGYAADSSATIPLKEAINNEPTGSNYYIDYVVYIATNYEGGKKLTGATLTATFAQLAKASGSFSDGVPDYFYATTVDIYVNGKYADSINYANKKTSADLLAKVGLTEIPCANVTDGYLTITLRCYFDGALAKTTGQAYVTTDNLNLDQIAIAVEFTATGTEATSSAS